MPLYYATKSRLKGLMWAALSGAAEVFGAVIVSGQAVAAALFDALAACGCGW